MNPLRPFVSLVVVLLANGCGSAQERSQPRQPDPATTTWAITVSSKPLGAKVIIDGEGLGSTPVIDHALPAGEHVLTLLTHRDIVERRIHVGPGHPQRYFWDGAAWH